MSPANRIASAAFVLLMILGAGSCIGVAMLERRLVPPTAAQSLDAKSPFIKAHLRSGYVYVLSSWRWDSAGSVITGTGQLYDEHRKSVGSGEYRLSKDSVALFESNVLKAGPGEKTIYVMAAITAGVAVACLSNPKACFGSCPTFYASDATGELLQAEGFSSSIAPALEATDIDALYRARPRGRDFTLRMTNEAYETHLVRSVAVLAVPRSPGSRVFTTTDGKYHEATLLAPATRCDAAEGSCTAATATFDAKERFSLADSVDLATRETIDLEFAQAGGDSMGVVIASRQTLMTTYLIYQALAYAGTNAARLLTMMDKPRDAEPFSALGSIEVLVLNSRGKWVVAGSTGETGPIATDTRVIPLPTMASGPVKIRLRMTKGLWRLDWVGLAKLRGERTPIRVTPVAVRRDGLDDPSALRDLSVDSLVLATYPGDSYEIVFRLPERPEEHELFLEARGYYLEWMREEWLAEENARRAATFALEPAKMFRMLAPDFKRLEPQMEEFFWKSRYVRR